MTVRVLYFASVRERLRRGEEDLVLEPGASVDDLWAALCGRHPVLAEVGASLRFAVNREYVDRGHRLGNGDEVAVIPPVSGGA